MAYESQMIALAKGAMDLHGQLKEVIFLSKNNDSILVFSDGTALPVQHGSHGYDIRREPYALRVAAGLGGTDPFSLLAFGYSGTGPACYSAFLGAAGFKQTDVVEIEPALKLRADGSKVGGARHQAKWETEISDKSIEEARQKIQQSSNADACIVSEEVICDGAMVTKTVTVQTASSEEAEKRARSQAPAKSEILDLKVLDKQATQTEKVVSSNETEASEKARGCIKPRESSYKSLAGISCVVKPRKGLFGVGKRIGEWEASFNLTSKEVTIRYRPLAKIKIHYGSRKLKCNQCGGTMNATTKGVNYSGASPSAESALLKLRCEKCNITRFEKRWEIEGEWVAWEDGSITVL
jgi:hypothetical protein